MNYVLRLIYTNAQIKIVAFQSTHRYFGEKHILVLKMGSSYDLCYIVVYIAYYKEI